MTATTEPEVGKSRLRKEDERLITGRTRWTDNLMLPGLQHMAILRSPIAHGRITGIDTSAARSKPGVSRFSPAPTSPPSRAACRRMADHRGHEGAACPVPRGGHGELRRRGRGRRGGPQRLRGADALEGIDVDYDDLPLVLDLAAAAADGADLVHTDLGTNVSAVWTFDSAEAGTGGDVEEAIRDAEV